MRTVAFALTCLLVIFGGGTAAADLETPPGTVFYVAPAGNDAWSGRRAEPNTARSDGPFATLPRARDEIRRLKKAGPLPDGGVTVYVSGGLYSLASTLELTAADSGTARAPVVYRAAPGQRPVVLGGRTITGFTPYKGQILEADVAAQGFRGVHFRQLFFDGRRQHLARYPNFDANNPYGGGWAYADGKPVPMYQEVPGESRRQLHYKAADARPWAHPEEVEVFVFPRYNWWNNIVPIKSLDPQQRLATLVADCSYPIRPGDRYYVQNALEELDAPGEWYLDRRSDTLYFWPPEPLASRAVYAPTLRTIVSFGPGTAYVTLRGLTLECCDGTAVVLNQTDHCLVGGCTIRNAGDYSGSGAAINGGTHNRVAGCDIYEIGSHGISLSGGDRPTLTAADNAADNNYIHHVGVFYKQGVGINLNGVGNRAAHNLIHDTPRMGIQFSGNNLVIEYNHIRHCNLETADTGAVYTGGRDWISSRGTQVRYNYFHDIIGFGWEDGRWVSPHFAWGIYLDDNTGGVDVVGNIVARSIRGLIHLHNGRDNLIENNIFIDGALQQMEYGGWTVSSRMWKDHFPTMVKGYESVAGQAAWRNMRNMDLPPAQAPLPNGMVMTGNVVRRNILYYHDPAAKLYSLRNVPLDHNQWDENLVWHQGQPLLTGQFRVKAAHGPNLLANPGFEDGRPGEMPTGWSWQNRPKTTAARMAVTGQARHAGRQALEIAGPLAVDAKGKPQRVSLVSTLLPAQPGETFLLTAWLRAKGPGVKAALAAQSYVSNVYYWAKEEPATVGPQWTEFQLAFRLPNNGEKGYHAQMKQLQARIDLVEGDGPLWIDDVTLRRAAPLDEWQSWQAAGQDRHSVVADPLFVDPDKDDYRLRPESPAFKLGFQPIPVEKIGPYDDPLRATWPIVEAAGAREHPTVLGR